uniref:Putative secreted protein n=1 Tax=Anopheles marajoara TaxID=58244 RepID=A0A2M4CD20_9DIPT
MPLETIVSRKMARLVLLTGCTVLKATAVYPISPGETSNERTETGFKEVYNSVKLPVLSKPFDSTFCFFIKNFSE